MGIGEARARGKVMSAGHSLRRQNYSFVGVTPPVVQITHTTSSTRFPRIVVAVVSAAALELATLATLMMLIAGR
jgi:hypothetical protein